MQTPNDQEMDCNCDDERVTMTRQRLNTICFPTLQSIAGLTILGNMEKFADEQIQSLSDSVRQLLLKQLEMSLCKFTKEYPCPSLIHTKFQDGNKCRKALACLCRLVGPKCTEFWLDWLLLLCPYKDKAAYICEVLNVLAIKAPQLQKLVIGRSLAKDHRYDSNVFGEMTELRSHGFGECLLAFQNLTSLTLNVDLLPEELVLLGQHMPKLEYLSCHFDLGRNCTPKGMSELQEAVSQMMNNLKRLKHLKFFRIKGELAGPQWFRPDSYIPLRQELTDFLVKHFPQLETIGWHGEVSLHKSREVAKIPQSSQLKEILLYITDSELHTNPFYSSSLSNISILNLSIHCSISEDWDTAFKLTPNDTLLRFSKVQKLCFEGIPYPEYHRIYLQNYGQNLTKLEIIITDDEVSVLSLMEIVAYCPKLEELVLGNVKHDRTVVVVLDLPSTFSSSTRILESLTKLHLTGSEPYSLESIFLAVPSVKEVKIEDFKPNAVEMKHLSHLVRSNQICTWLSSFEALFKSFSHWFDYETAGVGALCEFVKDICAFCPKMVYVNLKWDEDDRFATLTLEKDCCLQNCLNMMDNFFFLHRQNTDLFVES